MQSKATNPLLISIILIVLLALGFLLYRNSTRQTAAEAATISGIFDINGPLPKGATITLFAKEAYTNDHPQQFASGIRARDQGDWHLTGARGNASYEISGLIVANGKTIATAAPISITAPATDETLVFNRPPSNSTSTGAITGILDLNGYIPPHSTIVLEAKTPGTDYSVVADNIPAKDTAVFSYTTAASGQSYTIRAWLFDTDGNAIGTSDALTVTAPAQHEILRVNSTAQPPVSVVDLMTPTPTPQPAGISGTIDFNGASQQNTRIVIFERVSGSGDQYDVAQDHVSPQDGAIWQWHSAQSGTSYDLVAVLKQHHSNGTDTDLATSQIVTVAAPAAHEQFTINSGFIVPQQNGQITTDCGNYDSSMNTWLGNVTFAAIPNAQSYWIQIGTTNGGDQLTNNTTNATPDTPMVFSYPFHNATTYYARYAYSYVPNLLAYSTQFSPFSQTTSFTCSQ